jgi:glycosyltransferase involved in cell wall biosynthesis
MNAVLKLQHSAGRALARRQRRPFPLPNRSTRPAPHRADITVIVAAFAHEAFIGDSLRSILAQSYPDFLVLVVDDCSADATAARAAAIDDDRIVVTINDRNIGLGDTILQALTRVTTPYVALLNSDDLYHPDRLARCRDALEASPDMQVAATGVTPIDEDSLAIAPDSVTRLFDGHAICQWMRWFIRTGQSWNAPDLRMALLEANFLVTSSNIVCRTEFLRSRRESLRDFRYCFDWQVFVEAAFAGALLLIRDRLLGYRLHRANTIWFPNREHRTAFVREVNRVLANGLGLLQQATAHLPAAEQARIFQQAVHDHISRQPDAQLHAILVDLLMNHGRLPRAATTPAPGSWPAR